VCELVDTCGVYSHVEVIYMCYLLSHVACYIVIYIYIYVCVCVVVNVEKNKTKCGLFAERGRRQSGHCRGLLAITLGNSGKIFPARVFPVLPSIVAMGSRQRIFFKK
jgi:hypothetical protein